MTSTTSRTDQTIAERTDCKAIGNGETLTVTSALVHLQGNARPYFSCTADVTRGPGNRFARGGCLHEEILEHFPNLAPIVAVHLADDDGVPMHAADAAYWAGMSSMAPNDDYGRRTLETDDSGRVWAPATLAEHLRVDTLTAREIRQHVLESVPGSHLTAAAAWTAEVEALKPEWKHEADKALAIIKERGHKPAESAPVCPVTATAKQEGDAPANFGGDAVAWKVTLTYEGRSITVPFYMGAAHMTEGRWPKPKAPSAEEVLECLLSDAHFAECADEYEMAEELGEEVTRETRKTFLAILDQTRKLKQLLGADFDKFADA